MILGQAEAVPDEFTHDPRMFDAGPWLWYAAVWQVLSVVYMAFLVWMLVECARKDPDRLMWIFIILVLQPFGAFLYFFIRWLPGADVRVPKGLTKWTRGAEITRLEIAATQIGNAHQYIQLGDALRDVGRWDKAGEAYGKALAKDADNLQALWGAALVDLERHDFEAARGRLQKILAADAQYKFGDVSLAYGRSLYELKLSDEARAHLEKHVKRWRHPEGVFLLAMIHAENGNAAEARTQLLAMLSDINGSPRAIARKFGVWKARARKMLKKLPPVSQSR
jgi:hypothetical protein